MDESAHDKDGSVATVARHRVCYKTISYWVHAALYDELTRVLTAS